VISRREGLQLMLGVPQAFLLGCAVAEEEAPEVAPAAASRSWSSAQLGAWPLAETRGNTFADAIGGNTATLAVPSWTIATHEHDRPGIVAGSDHALEISNGGPAIPMVAAYRQAAMSLVVYVEPLGELRGTQYWDESHEAFGREFIACCDDGATPGSFALYRRRTAWNSDLWRLGGYVRNGAGAKLYFGDAPAGIASTNLLIDVAHRVVLTQGPAGASLWLDDAQVALLGAATDGWGNLTAPLHLGCSSDLGHANRRSPLWGRLDQIEIWQGQIEPASGTGARPPAAQSLRYRVPTDGPLINVADHGGDLQAAMDEADARGGYVYQEPSDTTWYQLPSRGSLGQRTDCRGMVGLRLRKAPNEGAGQGGGVGCNRTDFASGASHVRAVVISTNRPVGGKLKSGHGNPHAAAGGYRYIGCKFDGNARNQDWSIHRERDGTTYCGYNLQHAHLIFIQGQEGVDLSATIDACDFFDSTADGISHSGQCSTTVKSCRFYGVFRGAVVTNDLVHIDITMLRAEMHISAARIGGQHEIGTGLCDIEPFEPSGSDRILWRCYDAWTEGDWDDRNYEEAGSHSQSHYYNVHTTRPGFALQPHRENKGEPTSSIICQKCTLSFYRKGFGSSPSGGGRFPLEVLSGFTAGQSGLGALFDQCVFLANGRPITHVGRGTLDPTIDDGAPAVKLNYASAGVADTRLMTLRNCEFRATRVDHVPAADRRCIDFPALSEIQSIELDGLRIDAAFADLPFALGGMTVRHRNVLHERTNNTKPWSYAGAEVAL
jgi:hypothetical protein